MHFHTMIKNTCVLLALFTIAAIGCSEPQDDGFSTLIGKWKDISTNDTSQSYLYINSNRELGWGDSVSSRFWMKFVRTSNSIYYFDGIDNNDSLPEMSVSTISNDNDTISFSACPDCVDFRPELFSRVK